MKFSIFNHKIAEDFGMLSSKSLFAYFSFQALIATVSLIHDRKTGFVQ